MKTERIHCFECGKELKDQENIYHIGGDQYICEDCRDDYYYYCDDCNKLVRDIIPVDDGAGYVCDECARRYFCCDHCGELYSSGHIAVDLHYITLCIQCYGDHYFTCPTCEEVYHLDDGEYVGSWYYCRTCAENHLRTCIQPYSYKPNPVFYGGDNAGYGLEL
jgi:formylmethanofuran dehydrogenase subunit E